MVERMCSTRQCKEANSMYSYSVLFYTARDTVLLHSSLNSSFIISKRLNDSPEHTSTSCFVYTCTLK